MGRTERITIITLGAVIGVILLVLLGALYMLISDLRQTVSSVDGAVREIAKVQGVQEGVLNRLDMLPSLSESDEAASEESASTALGMPRPGRSSVSARQLWDDFDANQVRAAETYSEPSVWAVSGTVSSVQDAGGSIYVVLDGLVKVHFRGDRERVWLDKIDKGQHLWFECELRPAYYDGSQQYLDEEGFVVCISPND